MNVIMRTDMLNTRLTNDITHMKFVPECYQALDAPARVKLSDDQWENISRLFNKALADGYPLIGFRGDVIMNHLIQFMDSYMPEYGKWITRVEYRPLMLVVTYEDRV